MAAIDKICVNSYYDYDELRRWAIVYYPELLFYFYDISITPKQWEENRKYYVKGSMEIAKRDYKKLGDFSCVPEAEYNLKSYYLKSVNYICTARQATEEVKYIIEAYGRTKEDWEERYEAPITNTPFSVDRKLLWICPIPFVRKYLEETCGYKTRWYHKLFWRGKKYFCL